MWFLYMSYKIWGKNRSLGYCLNFFNLLKWHFFRPRPKCCFVFSTKLIICISGCESCWHFYFPLNAFPRNISFQEVRYFVGVVWNPQEVPSHVLLFMMLLFVIWSYFSFVFVVPGFMCTISVPSVQIASVYPSSVVFMCAFFFFSF